jgi:LEA14-like dessication related protein
MQNKSIFPILLIVGGAIYYFSRLKVTGENLKVNLKNLGIKKGSGLSLPKINLTFDIQNITNNTVNLYGIVGDIYVNGSYLANINNLTPTYIKPLSTTILEVQLNTSILDAAPIIKDLITTTGKRNLKVTADLKLNVNGILVPLKIDKTIL